MTTLKTTVTALALAIAGTTMAQDRPVAEPNFGWTSDNIAGLANQKFWAQGNGTGTFPFGLNGAKGVPWIARVVFDPGEPPSYYTNYLQTMAGGNYILGLPVDSSAELALTMDQSHARMQQYLDAMMPVDVWETCNECNGSWASALPGSQVGADVAAKAIDRNNLVKSYPGKKTLLTLYYELPNCVSEPDMIAFVQKYFTQADRDKFDYVGISYYPEQCKNPSTGAPQLGTAAQFTSVYQQLAGLFPLAKLVWSEIGTVNNSASLAKQHSYATTFYSYLPVIRQSLPQFVGWGMWWNAKEQAFSTAPSNPPQPTWTDLFNAARNASPW